MTSPKGTLASAAREVTLYLALTIPLFSGRALLGPVPGPSIVPPPDPF